MLPMTEGNSIQAKEPCKFYMEGKCRFGDNCWNIHDDMLSKKNSRKENKEFKDVDSIEKKPPMRTASDVLSRLQWDEKFNQHLEEFTVGYLDRFIGIVERGFTEFNWNDDIASVDDLSGVLAIPQHRIMYFKFNDLILWDKSKRIDLIFGSTGDERVKDLNSTDVCAHSECSDDVTHGSYQLTSSLEDISLNNHIATTLKPAQDVLWKFRWAENFKNFQDDVIVGYLDEDGLFFEIKFCEIVWNSEMLSVYNYDGLLTTIENQILFIKFKNVILWDKSEEIDLIFGSTGNKIIDSLQSFENQSGVDHEVYCPSVESSEYATKSLNQTFDVADDDDTPNSITSPLNLFNMLAAATRAPVNKQTHFLAVRLNNTFLLKNLTKLLQCMESTIPEVKPCLYKQEMLHVTICTLALYSVKEMRAAVASVGDLVKRQNDIFWLLPQIRLDITGLGEFHHKILHAKVSNNNNFKHLMRSVKSHLWNSGIPVTSDENWIPHVTLAKSTRGSGQKCRMDKILKRDLGHYKDHMFGSQIIDNIHLCVVGGPKRADGFYSCLFEECNLLDNID